MNCDEGLEDFIWVLDIKVGEAHNGSKDDLSGVKGESKDPRKASSEVREFHGPGRTNSDY